MATAVPAQAKAPARGVVLRHMNSDNFGVFDEVRHPGGNGRRPKTYYVQVSKEGFAFVSEEVFERIKEAIAAGTEPAADWDMGSVTHTDMPPAISATLDRGKMVNVQHNFTDPMGENRVRGIQKTSTVIVGVTDIREG